MGDLAALRGRAKTDSCYGASDVTAMIRSQRERGSSGAAIRYIHLRTPNGRRPNRPVGKSLPAIEPP